jgi:hypothetical protein
MVLGNLEFMARAGWMGMVDWCLTAYKQFWIDRNTVICVKGTGYWAIPPSFRRGLYDTWRQATDCY